MITKAVKSMLPQIISLWEECFGDPEEYSSFFFANNLHGTGIFDNLYVVIEDGVPVSMLTVLEATLVQECESNVFWYIYGVATAKEHRKKGYAGKLLEYVLREAKENGAIAGLVPANKSLFDYYKKFGFETFFYKKILELNDSSYEKDNCNIKYQLADVGAEQYNQMRNNTFSLNAHIEWSDRAVQYALEENKRLGGKTLKVTDEQGAYFIMYYPYEGTLYVRETNIPVSLLAQAVCYLCEENACQKANISLAADYPIETDIVGHAMVFGGKSLGENSYFGLALD